MAHREWHRSQRIGWLRAAVLGANDGVISTASLMVGVAATGYSTSSVLTVGIAGLAAGAMSMAAGEYVSVQSQVDVEHADIAKERGNSLPSRRQNTQNWRPSIARVAWITTWHSGWQTS